MWYIPEPDFKIKNNRKHPFNGREILHVFIRIAKKKEQLVLLMVSDIQWYAKHRFYKVVQIFTHCWI